MARKKKQSEPVFVRAGVRDNLVKISIKTGVKLEQLRALNPDIKNIIFTVRPGKDVRIA